MGMNAHGMEFMGWPMLLAGAVVLAVLVILVLLILVLRRPVAGPFRPELDESLSRNFEPDIATAEMDDAADPGAKEIEAVLVIPDISGYTRFIALNRFSLGHAQYILSQLLNEIIDAAADRLRVAKVEGDAVLLYAARDPGQGTIPDVGEAVTDLLTAFYRRRRALALSNACRCTACANLEQLDLKVVVEFGPILQYRLRGAREICGHAVIVAHRLLKNSLNLSRYVLVTEAARNAVRLPWSREGRQHRESYADLGEITTYVHDVDPEDLLAETPPAEHSYATIAADAGSKLRRNLKALVSEAESR